MIGGFLFRKKIQNDSIKYLSIKFRLPHFYTKHFRVRYLILLFIKIYANNYSIL